MIRRLVLAAVFAIASPAAAQNLKMEPIPAPAGNGAIPLETGGVDGATAPESWYAQNGVRTVRNVQHATLIPVLPDPAKATGAAVIVAPGGGFLMLSMDSEGWSVAHWLADHGIAAFVLKYRLTPTPADIPGFQRQFAALLAGAGKTGALLNPEIIERPIADARAALALVRARSTLWHVDPKRVGLLGFSAGAITAVGLTLHATPETQPAFVAPIYGAMDSVVVPPSAPPMFAVLASNDPLFGNRGFGLIEAWRKARRPVEFHLYQKGGHGFGMGSPGTTSGDWKEAFVRWLDMNGFLKDKS